MSVKAVAARRAKTSISSPTTQQTIKNDAVSEKPNAGFVYSGKDYNGKALKRVPVPYQTEAEARMRLAEAGITVEKIAPASNAFAFLNFKKNWKPSVKDLANLADQLAAQKSTGITWDRITLILARVHPKKQVREALFSVSEKIADATPPDVAFAQEMDRSEPNFLFRLLGVKKKVKPFFPTSFVYAFQIAEEIGAFPDPETGVSADAPVVMLRFFARGQRKTAATIKALISGLISPVAIFIVCIIVFFFEVYFIVPQFAEIFIGLLAGKDSSLPLPTQIMLDISDFFYSWFGIILTLSSIAGFFGAVYYFTATEKGIDKRGRLVLVIPIIKDFFLPFYGASFIRNMAILTNDNNVTRQFDVLAQTTDSPPFKELARHCQETLFNNSPTLPQIFQGHLHLTGEMFAPVLETIEQNPGQQQILLYSYSKDLEEQADDNLAVMISLLSNTVYIFAALMVFFILIASYAPLITMVGRLAGGGK